MGVDPVNGPSAWYGRDLAASDEWVHRLTAPEIDEIEAATSRLQRRGYDLARVGAGDFPLPALGPVLSDLRDQVVHGRGFVVVRGLPVDRYDRETAALAFWGIGAHIGWAVSQNAKGHLLGHVTDIGQDPANPHHRLYATSARHRFHTDSCDVVALLCLRPAKRGGLSSIASSVTVYHEMAASRPDLVRVLASPFHVDRKGEVPEGKRPYYRMPVFNEHGGLLSTIYARDFIEGAQRFEEVPRLTEAQVEAMDMLEALAARDDIRLDMQLEPGDVQVLHNHQILHSRTAFEDHPEPHRKRHLLRLWLCPPDGRALPPVFAERYGSVERGKPRGGIVVPGARLHAPLQPA